MGRRCVLSLMALFSLAPAASAASLKPDTGGLSSDLYTLSSPQVRNLSHAEQAVVMGLGRHGPGSLIRDRSGRVLVEITTTGKATARVRQIAAAGAEIVEVTPRYDTVTAAVAPADLRAVAAAPGVASVIEVIEPMTGRVSAAPSAEAGAINTCPTGVVSEGNAQLRADVAKTQYDVDGDGVEVGVLSDSYDTKTDAATHAAGDVATGDLPGPGNPCGRTEPVQVLDDTAGPQGDEGRAMIQIVHDIAPGASLAFATAFTGQVAFANNIRALAANGAKVIVDDIIYFNEPMFQDGIVANAVSEVTAQGVTYFSMAFNNNIVSGGNDVASFEAPAFRQTGCPGGLPVGVTQCMDFNGGAGTDNTYAISVPDGARVRLALQWNQPQRQVTTDLDAYLLGTSAATMPTSENFNVGSGTQQPFEFLDYTNVANSGPTETVNLVISRDVVNGDSLNPRLKVVFAQNGAQSVVPTEYTTSANGDIVGPTIFGHNGTALAQTVGAVPFNNSNTMEAFSSRGPVTHYFGPVSGSTPAAPLSPPLVLNKPDISATDRGINTFFGSGNRFSGTSAAAPHAAAVGALQLSANPALTAGQVKTAQRATARPVGAFGPLAAGAGLIDAQAAITASPPPAPPTVSFSGGPDGATNLRTPTFTFVTSHIKTATCTVDGGPAQDCTAGSFTTPSLGDGPHSAAVIVTDYFGQTATASRAFSVDATAPAPPTFQKGPKKKTKSRKATFRFSGEAGATFACALDKAAFSPCTSPAKVKVKKAKPKPKRHTFAVQPADALGNVGPTAAYKWKVVKK